MAAISRSVTATRGLAHRGRALDSSTDFIESAPNLHRARKAAPRRVRIEARDELLFQRGTRPSEPLGGLWPSHNLVQPAGLPSRSPMAMRPRLEIQADSVMETGRQRRAVSFFRHGKSFAPMVALGGSDQQGSPPRIIVTMSFYRLFLGGLLSSSARFRYTGCELLCTTLAQFVNWIQPQRTKEDIFNRAGRGGKF